MKSKKVYVATIVLSLKKSILFSIILFFLLPSKLSTAQNSPDLSPETIDVFLDCRTHNCSESYIREKIPFINYVRNEDDADLHLLITTQQTGSGGEEFTLQFIGNNEFTEMSRSLTYFSAESDTDDEIRNGLNDYIKKGLFFFLANLPVSENLTVNYIPIGVQDDTPPVDNWDSWIFELNADTDLEGEESEKEFSLQGNASAERITPEWKLQFGIQQYYERRKFEDDDTTRTFVTESRGADLLAVKSLSDHWSFGGSSNLRSSTRDNLALSANGSLALEYSIFPYEEFTEREITFLYRITGAYNDYNEQTIYGKSSEFLLEHQLRSNIRFTQPWGEFETEINASAYLHDMSKNRLVTESQLNFRIYRGLSIYVSGEYAWINNQLSIPAGDITDAEKLLNLRQQFTSYSYQVRFGLSFSFGSIYNNVVNPRL
ncbi:MAG TPA: hypothetical protein VFM80_05820 [Gracilimonas sp.]|uniref:hypothetical protein n=1 Tax=Gracilimonas sp. TaxID=1974203 RepID=UPI002D8BCF52|nr:hypothetical protein [Gracilimonas sp.]